MALDLTSSSPGSKPLQGPQKGSDLPTVTQHVHDKVTPGLLSLQPRPHQICLNIPVYTGQELPTPHSTAGKVHTVSSLPCLFLYLNLLSSVTCPCGLYPSLWPPVGDSPSIVHFSLSTRSWSLNVFFKVAAKNSPPAYLHPRSSLPPNAASGGTSPSEDRRGFHFPVLLSVSLHCLLPRG